jgi:hypothetical protein
MPSVRLFDAFRGPHWTLLTVGTDVPLPPFLIPTIRIPAYEAHGTGVFLVRPDGYIGWADETAAGLDCYAARPVHLRYSRVDQLSFGPKIA